MTNNITVRDSSSVVQTVKTTDTAGIHTPHHNVDNLPADVENDISSIATASTAILAAAEAIQAAAEILAATVSASRVSTSVDTSLPAGSNVMGKVSLQVSGSDISGGNPVPVSGSVTTSGTVTANAGTNLNTSALALESGGNLAAAVASLSVLDDWDESDRAKTNPIVGQAGVAAGTGVDSATTQRVTLATNVALPTGTNSIGQVTANAGTNLNTSLLALESGGNLASAAASLSVLDDWDSSDRCSVSPIAGQTGVQGGSGTVNALTQRVVLATDVALPTGSNIIGAVKIDQTTHGTTDKVAADLFQGGTAVSPTNPAIVKSNSTTVSANFTRPNDTSAYAALDVISNSTSAPVVMTFSNVSGIAAGNVVITGTIFRLDEAAIPSGETGFRLHLYDAAPTAINDNAAYDLVSGDRAKYLGYLTLSTPLDLGSTCFSQDANVNYQCKLASASTTLYGILQTISAFTPVAQVVYTVGLRVIDI